MAKTVQKTVAKPEVKQIQPLGYTIFPFANSIVAYFVLLLLGVGIYWNTTKNEFALDDGIIIHNNAFVQKGVSGIDSILTQDSYYSFFKKMGGDVSQVEGHYRPLSIVTFALEQEFIGKPADPWHAERAWDLNKNGKPDLKTEDISGDGIANEKDVFIKGSFMRHLNNVLFFVLSVLLLFYLLKTYVLKNYIDVAFLASLLFLVHPIHTEVVANIKSRDEILSFLFVVCTFIFTFKYYDSKKILDLVLVNVFLFLSFLSKEYAVVLLILLPLALYFTREDFGLFKDFKISGTLFATTVIFMIIRFSIVDLAPENKDTGEILNDPYLWAEEGQVFPTKIYVLLRYIGLLFFPHPLSSFYGFKTIEYQEFSSLWVIASVIVHGALVYVMFKLFKSKHPISFALFVYFGFLALIANIFIYLGAALGERLIYHASWGFVMAIAWLIVMSIKKYIGSEVAHKSIVWGLTVVIVGLCSFKTIDRNKDWKNDISLFIKDASNNPNDIMLLGNASARYADLGAIEKDSIKKMEYYAKSEAAGRKAVSMHRKYVNGYLNLGLSQFKQHKYWQAVGSWDTVRMLFPSNPYLMEYNKMMGFELNSIMNDATKKMTNKQFDVALKEIRTSLQIAPRDAKIWLYKGLCHKSLSQLDSAKLCFNTALQIAPKDSASLAELNLLSK